MKTLSNLRAEAAIRRAQILSAIGPMQDINPPSWQKFGGQADGTFFVSLNPPLQSNGTPYLVLGGSSYPMETNPGQLSGHSESASQGVPVVFYYQVQTSTNAGFTANLASYDIGTATQLTFRTGDATLFARARARLATTSWSQWRPAPNSVSVASPPAPPSGVDAGSGGGLGGGARGRIFE